MNTADTKEILAKLSEGNKEICLGDSKAYDQITSHVPPRAVFPDEKPESKEAPLATWMKSMLVSAVGFAAVSEGKIACVGVAGKLDPRNPNSPPVTTKTMFPIASITKPMVAYAVIRVLEKYNAEHKSETKITLDTPIDRFFPPIPNTYPFTFDKRKITGLRVAKIILEMSKNNPAKTLALIAQFKEWARVHNRHFNMQDVNKLEQETLSKHEFLYGSWQARNMLRKFVGQGITIRKLLEHSSGIQDYSSSTPRFPFIPSSTKVSLLTLYHAIFDSSFSGTWGYSNTGYVLLEMLLESLLQTPFPEVMKIHVFDPLDMKNTTASESEKTFAQADHEFIYCIKSDGAIPEKRGLMPRGSGGIHTSPEDLARFALKLMEIYKCKDVDPVKEMFTKQNRLDADGKPCEYGLGLNVSGNGDDQFFGHSGGFASCSANMFIYPKQQSVEAVMINNLRTDLCEQVLSAISATYKFPENPRLQTNVLIPLSEAQVQKFKEYQGEYKMTEGLVNIKVTLLFKDGWPSLQLLDTKLNTPPQTFLLSRDEEGNIVSLSKNMKLQFNDSHHTIELPEYKPADHKKEPLRSTGTLISKSKQETSNESAEISEEKEGYKKSETTLSKT